jgi:hypothetical protein
MISVLLDSASTALMKIQSQQRRQFRVYVRRAPSPKFETLSISCERNIADGRRCQSHRKKGIQIVQAVQPLRFVQNVHQTGLRREAAGSSKINTFNRFTQFKPFNPLDLVRGPFNRFPSHRHSKPGKRRKKLFK